MCRMGALYIWMASKICRHKINKPLRIRKMIAWSYRSFQTKYSYLLFIRSKAIYRSISWYIIHTLRWQTQNYHVIFFMTKEIFYGKWNVSRFRHYSVANWRKTVGKYRHTIMMGFCGFHAYIVFCCTRNIRDNGCVALRMRKKKI